MKFRAHSTEPQQRLSMPRSFPQTITEVQRGSEVNCIIHTAICRIRSEPTLGRFGTFVRTVGPIQWAIDKQESNSIAINSLL